MDTLSINPIVMFEQAGPVGKVVMLVLLASSIWCWLLIVEGMIAVWKLDRAVKGAGGEHPAHLISGVLTSGDMAARLKIAGESVGERRQRISEAMQREARDLLTRAEGGLANLAVISSVAPFVGLFGTVWGIMTSFVGIAAAQDTSLGVVAPGIAEALAATAFGLAAAIPASIGYTRIGFGFSHAGQHLMHFVESHAVALVADRSKSGEQSWQ